MNHAPRTSDTILTEECWESEGKEEEKEEIDGLQTVHRRSIRGVIIFKLLILHTNYGGGAGT